VLVVRWLTRDGVENSGWRLYWSNSGLVVSQINGKITRTYRFQADVSRMQVKCPVTLSLHLTFLYLVGSVKNLVFTYVKHAHPIQNVEYIRER
jgi:hypothetical protein